MGAMLTSLGSPEFSPSLFPDAIILWKWTEICEGCPWQNTAVYAVGLGR